MNFAEIRARLEAVEQGHPVHIHGCFGKVNVNAPAHAWCTACERPVELRHVAFSDPKAAEYRNDVAALLHALDEAEDRLATLEDEAHRG